MKYACNPKTVVRAKVNSSGVVAACATNRCADKVAITVTAQVRECPTEAKRNTARLHASIKCADRHHETTAGNALIKEPTNSARRKWKDEAYRSVTP